MAEIQLARLSPRSVGWKGLLALLLAIGLLGLGVKSIWFDSTAYLVPASTIPVGARLSSEHFKIVRVNLGQLRGQYLTAGTLPGGFASQTLLANQLIPAGSTVSNAPESVSRLVVTTKTQVGSGIRAGARVSIWSARRISGNQFDVPAKLAGGAQVSRVLNNSGVFGGQNQQVEVLVDPIQAPALLAAMASDSPIFLVANQ